MDIRSFDLNFEMMSVIHGSAFASQLERLFLDDLVESVEVNREDFRAEGSAKRLGYAVARLVSSFL